MFPDIEQNEPQKYLSSSILEVFKEDIQKKYISTEIIRKKIDSEESLKSAQDNAKEQKRILDSIRYIIGKESESISSCVFTSSQTTLTSASSPGGDTMKFGKESVTDLPTWQRYAFGDILIVLQTHEKMKIEIHSIYDKDYNRYIPNF